MKFEIENNYYDEVFFIANIQTPIRKIKKVLQATSMGALLTDINLPEHFEVNQKNVLSYNIVAAYQQNITHIISNDSQYYKYLYNVTHKNFAIKPEVNFITTAILQGIAFDKFFTDAFNVQNINDAQTKLLEWCNTTIIFNQINCKTIKQIILK